MKKTQINKVNQGTYFRLTESDKAPVWIRGEFIREAGKYSCYKFDDTNHEKLMKGTRTIYINFEF